MKLYISSILFSDGSEVTPRSGEIIVIVGPNNSGKSATLRNIFEKVQNPANTSKVIQKVGTTHAGTNEEVVALLTRRFRQYNTPPDNPRFEGVGVNVHRQHAIHFWQTQDSQGMRELIGAFCRLLTAEQRISAANPPGRISLTQQGAQHPIHLLERDDRLEEKLRVYFRNAFGTDITVHRAAGSNVPLMVGERPMPRNGEDRVSFGYIQDLEKLPQLETQGDGMRSFAGILLNIIVGEEPVLLIDEPEAFLHPPQARMLGRMLARETKSDRQVIAATHSSDFLRGVLDEPERNVRVIRITRRDEINPVTTLDANAIKALWNDPLLRYSNILDGLFHERVVVCESDGDCRFYSAIADALSESTSETRKPIDVLYTHCGGKARIPAVIRSLRHVAVSVIAVPDFDVLNDEYPLREIVEAAGGDWSTISPDWKIVKSAVDSKKPELGTEETRREIQTILSSISESPFPPRAKSDIEKILRRSSPWSIAKTVGTAFVPNGDASAALARLLKNLKTLGVFIPEVGELESFAKTVPGHGPSWVNAVLERNLKSDPELRNAREFVEQFAL